MEKNNLQSVLFEAISSAGTYLNNIQKEDISVEYKSNSDLVTHADLTSDRIIKDTIRKYYPNSSFWSEEGCEIIENSKEKWIIDPIDGTVNFISNIPLFAISIAYEKNDELLAGIISQPSFNNIIYTEKGTMSTKNSKPCTVSDTKLLKDSMVSIITTNHFTNELKDYISEIFRLLSKECRGVRVFVSASFELALVATGKIDGAVLPNADFYGIKAGELIVKNSGGKLTNTDNQPFIKSGDLVVASNSTIHNSLIDLIKRAGNK